MQDCREGHIDRIITLVAYRAKELTYLIEETGHIETMSYELILKTLDHIEIVLDGNPEVIFLAGRRIRIKI